MSDYKPTNDYIFGRIFGHKKNSDLLKDLLEAILPDIEIKMIELNKQVSLERKLMRDKLGVLDILATLNNDIKVNIEMQVTDYHNTIDRSLFYDAGVYHESLQKNEDYLQIPKVIGIWILGYDLFDEGPFHETARFRRDYNKEELTDKIELHYIQLPKFKQKCKRISNKLEQWLTFIINENLEAIKMIDNEFVKETVYGVTTYQDEIDEINILQATKKGLHEAVANMEIKPNVILVDALTGIDTLGIPYKSIIKGDAKSYSIGAASIIAKVTRDRIMREWDKVYPEYGFAGHKGYGTAKHIEAIKKYGLTPIHRRSFCKNFV